MPHSIRTLRDPQWTREDGESSPADSVHISVLAEGYLESESEIFFADVARHVNEVFFAEGAAFKSLQPFLSVHAIMVASESAGVGTLDDARGGGLRTKARRARRGHSTAFSLQREDGPLRTVAPPGSGRDVYRKAKQICAAMAPVVSASPR